MQPETPDQWANRITEGAALGPADDPDRSLSFSPVTTFALKDLHARLNALESPAQTYQPEVVIP